VASSLCEETLEEVPSIQTYHRDVGEIREKDGHIHCYVGSMLSQLPQPWLVDNVY
jgi:hypothetical protein